MAILDQYGRPVSTATLRRGLMEPEAVGAYRAAVSGVQAVVDPSELGAILREAEAGNPLRYLELAELLEERDLHYLGVLGTRRRQVSQLPIRVVDAEESPEGAADGDLLREWLRRDELEDELFDALDAIGKGFSVLEILWDLSERQWMPARLEWRRPVFFRFDLATGATLERRTADGAWTALEPGKFVEHRHAAKSGLPIRGGLARPVAWAVAFKNFGVRDWLRFAEAYGHPLRIGRYDSQASKEDKDTLLRAVRRIASDFAATIPESMTIDFIESTGTGVRSDLYQDILKYFDAAISKAVLGQTLTTQEGDRGARSLGEVHDSVRGDIERSDARQLGATLTRSIGRLLVLLNRGDPGERGFPRFQIGREDEHDAGEMANALAALVPLGLEVKADQVLSRLGLDAPKAGDKILGAARPGNGGPAFARALARALARGETGGGDAIDDAVEALLDGGGWERVADPTVGAALEAARGSAGYEELRRAIDDGSILERMDADPVVTALLNLAFGARLSGDAGLDER